MCGERLKLKNKYKILLFFAFAIILVSCNYGSGLEPADLDKNTSVTPSSDKLSIFNNFANLKSKLPKKTNPVYNGKDDPGLYTNAKDIEYFTNPNFVFFGSTVESDEINTSPAAAQPASSIFRNIFILEFRKKPNSVDELIVSFSFVNEKRLAATGNLTVNELYNARTLLPAKSETIKDGKGGIDLFVGLWPYFQKMTYLDLAVTNGATLGFINILQNDIYTNILAGSNNLYSGAITSGVLTTNDLNSLTPIPPNATIASIRSSTENKLWKSIAVQRIITPPPPVTAITSTNYFLKEDGNVALDPEGTAALNAGSPNTYTYAWDIFKQENNTLPGENSNNDAFLYIYRKMRLIIKQDTRTTDEQSFDEIVLIPPIKTTDGPGVIPFQLKPSGVLLRLSIKP